MSFMPNQPKTPMRGVRLDDDLWTRLGKAAEQRGVYRSDIIREAVVEYLARHFTPKTRRRTRQTGKERGE